MLNKPVGGNQDIMWLVAESFTELHPRCILNSDSGLPTPVLS